MSTIVLASASPRRAELLAQLGVPFRVKSANIDESVHPDEQAEAYVERIAREKARVVFEANADDVVLSADTSVVVDGNILGKPRSREHALEMLGSLSARTHRVLTAVCVVNKRQIQSVVQQTEVTFAELSSDWLQWYWETGEPVDKAGAYAIQGLAASKISEIKGSYSGVMGLPLYETAELLRGFGVKLQDNQ